MPVIREEWADAYAIQARSDFAIYETFTQSDTIEACHGLHYLQMACEKIAKSYRLRDTETSIEDTVTSHKAFSKFIEGFLKSPAITNQYKGRRNVLQHIERFARGLAEDIEKLAPAVDRGKTPQNAEYPWEANEKIICPCKYEFPNLIRLRTSEGRNFLKIIGIAFSDYDKIRL